MKNIVLFIVVCFVALVIHYSQEPAYHPPKFPGPKTNYNPDPYRKVHHFDWDKFQYVYYDELQEDTAPKSTGPLEYFPDFHVSISGQTTTAIPQPHNNFNQVIIEGQRYRVFKRANGDIDLQPMR